MTATARPTARTAAAPTTAPAPRHQPAPRPPLRVVSDEELLARSRRRRNRLLVFLTSVLVVGGLFGLAAAHVVLTQNQFRLEQLNRQADVEQAKYERQRLEVARLESPSRIVAAAQERLGMVPPTSVKYLTPAKAATAPVPAAATAGTAATNTAKAANTANMAKATTKPASSHEQAMEQWAAVKRQLDNRP
jgi:cell division protein FtsL